MDENTPRKKVQDLLRAFLEGQLKMREVIDKWDVGDDDELSLTMVNFLLEPDFMFTGLSNEQYAQICIQAFEENWSEDKFWGEIERLSDQE